MDECAQPKMSLGDTSWRRWDSNVDDLERIEAERVCTWKVGSVGLKA